MYYQTKNTLKNKHYHTTKLKKEKKKTLVLVCLNSQMHLKQKQLHIIPGGARNISLVCTDYGCSYHFSWF